MRAKDLPPGTEVAVGGSRYDRRFAIVVATGPWARSGSRMVIRAGHPVVALLTARNNSNDKARAWWAAHRDTDPAELTDGLTIEPLTNVRCRWVEEEDRRDRLARKRLELQQAQDAARERVERLRDLLLHQAGLRTSISSDSRFGLRLILLPDEAERWLEAES